MKRETEMLVVHIVSGLLSLAGGIATARWIYRTRGSRHPASVRIVSRPAPVRKPEKD